MEHAVNAEMLANYGYSVAIENPLTPSQGAPLYMDIVHIFQVRREGSKTLASKALASS